MTSARRIDAHLQRSYWHMLGQYVAVAAFLIMSFQLFKGLEQREALHWRVTLSTLAYAVSESFAHLCALAFFSVLQRMRERRELLLLAAQYRSVPGLVRSYLPVLFLLLTYQTFYFGFLKPDVKAMGRSAMSRAALIEQHLQHQHPIDIKGGWFWSRSVSGTQFRDPCYLMEGAQGDIVMHSDAATVHEKVLEFGPGLLSVPNAAMPLTITYTGASLPVFSGESWLDYTKPLPVLLQQSQPFLRVQQRLVQILTPWFLVALAFSISSLRIENSWRARFAFLLGLFVIHLPLQIFCRKLAFDTHGVLVLLHWFEPLSLLAYVFLLWLCTRRTT